MVDLYHFSRVGYDAKARDWPSTLALDPAQFSHTEKMRSNVPRIFFYPDTPAHAYNDHWGIRKRKLYKTTMPAAQIYDMTVDPDGIVQAGKNENGYIDQEKVMNAIKERYPAAYMEGRFPVVLVFEPITVHRVDDREKDMMMKKAG